MRLRAADVLEGAGLSWRLQEVAFSSPESCCFFRIDGSKAVVSTPTALRLFGMEKIARVFAWLEARALEHQGLDYLQVFEDRQGHRLWVIEDGQAITALLPEDY